MSRTVKIELTLEEWGEVQQLASWAIDQLNTWKQTSIDKPYYDKEIKKAKKYELLFFNTSESDEEDFKCPKCEKKGHEDYGTGELP